MAKNLKENIYSRKMVNTYYSFFFFIPIKFVPILLRFYIIQVLEKAENVKLFACYMFTHVEYKEVEHQKRDESFPITHSKNLSCGAQAKNGSGGRIVLTQTMLFSQSAVLLVVATTTIIVELLSLFLFHRSTQVQ